VKGGVRGPSGEALITNSLDTTPLVVISVVTCVGGAPSIVLCVGRHGQKTHLVPASSATQTPLTWLSEELHAPDTGRSGGAHSGREAS
jgi:hypothetical protein